MFIWFQDAFLFFLFISFFLLPPFVGGLSSAVLSILLQQYCQVPKHCLQPTIWLPRRVCRLPSGSGAAPLAPGPMQRDRVRLGIPELCPVFSSQAVPHAGDGDVKRCSDGHANSFMLWKEYTELDGIHSVCECSKSSDVLKWPRSPQA